MAILTATEKNWRTAWRHCTRLSKLIKFSMYTYSDIPNAHLFALVFLNLSVAINAIAMTAIAVTIKKHAPTVPTISKTAIIGWQSSYIYISMPNCRQMTLASTSSQPLSAHTVHCSKSPLVLLSHCYR